MTTPVEATTPPRPQIIRLYPADRRAQWPMEPRLAHWCMLADGTTDPRLRYRSTASGCGCAAPLRYWTMDRDMLADYGPLPFTSHGRTIRWRWWHALLGAATFTVYDSDFRSDE